MRSLLKSPSRFVIYLLEVIWGLIMFFNPVGLTTAMLDVFGIALVLLGLYNVIRYFREPASVASEKLMLFHGSVLLFVGAFAIMESEAIINGFPFLTLIYGTGLILAALLRLQSAVDSFRAKKNWKFQMGYCLITLILAIVVLANPFNSVKVLSRIVGATLFLIGVIDPVYEIHLYKTAK